MNNLPMHSIYAILSAELYDQFKYLYDVAIDKATSEQRQQFISALEMYINSIKEDGENE